MTRCNSGTVSTFSASFRFAFSRYEVLPRNAVREERLKNCFTEYARQTHADFIPRQSHGMRLSFSLLDLAGTNYLGIPENFYCHPRLDLGTKFYFMMNRRNEVAQLAARSITEVLDFLTFFANISHCLDSHFKVHIDKFSSNFFIHFLGFNSFRK